MYSTLIHTSIQLPTEFQKNVSHLVIYTNSWTTSMLVTPLKVTCHSSYIRINNNCNYDYYHQHVDICGKREHNADTTIGVAHECFQAVVVPIDFTFTKQNDKNPITIILHGKKKWVVVAFLNSNDPIFATFSKLYNLGYPIILWRLKMNSHRIVRIIRIICYYYALKHNHF